MSYLNIEDVSTYTVPENTALIYAVDGAYKFKTAAGVVGDVPATTLPLLAVEITDIPCLVWQNDLDKALSKTVVSTENVTIAMSAKASVGFVREIAARKVDSTDFLTAMSRTGESIEALQDELNANKAVADSAAAKAAANEEAISKEITDRGDAINAAKGELSGDISEVAKRVGDNETDIAAIKAELNGGVEGEEGGASVAERLAALEDATAVETTDDAPIIVPVDRDGDEVNEASKLNDAYAPVLKFNGAAVGVLNNEINIIGDGNVSVVNGKITLRLGPNLNSSAFNTNDGHADRGNAAASASGLPTVKNVLADGTAPAVVWVKGGDITVKHSNTMHFDGTESTFKCTIGDKVYTFGPIVGNGTYKFPADSDTPEAKVVISGWAAEPKTGATGYCGKAEFTFSVARMGLADGKYRVTVEHIGSTGAAVFNTDYFYLVNDSTTKASASNAVVTLTGTSAKTVSGVSYLTAGTVNASATIADAFNPASYSASGSTVTYVINGWANNPSNDTLTFAENGASSGKSTTLKHGEFAADATTVTITPTNINGTGTAAVASLGKALLIDKTTAGTTGDVAESFDNESRRLTEGLVAWDSADSLADGAAGAEGLMVKNGALIYPVGTYTGFNDGFNGIVGANQPDYSACTGERSYVRKLYKNASLGGGTFTITHNKSLSSFVTAGTLKFEVSKDGSTWYDITKLVKDGGIGTAFNWGTTSSSVTFAFTDGAADKNIYVRIAMASSSVDVQITNLEANLA